MLRQILDPALNTVEPDTKVVEAARLMAKQDTSAVLVLTNGRPRGILTDRDIVVRCLGQNVDAYDCTVEQVLSESLVTVHEDCDVFDCIQKMREAGVHRIPVVDAAGKAVGMVHYEDVLSLLSQEFSELAVAGGHKKQAA